MSRGTSARLLASRTDRADHALGRLFHRDALRQGPGLIHVAVSEDCDVIGQELERHRKQEPPQAVQQQWDGVLATDISDNAMHGRDGSPDQCLMLV